MIATFEEQPYRGRFSGNVIELCPVGALTSTQYRFKARPWEITDIPTRVRALPHGLQHLVDACAKATSGACSSRNHPGVDEGWLCDKGRFAHVHLHAGDRYLQGLVRGPRGLEPASAEQLAETIARRLRHHATLHGPESIAVVASGEQSNEEAHAWAELVRAAGGGALVSSGFAGADWDALAPYEAPIAELDHADLIVVSGEREVGDAAGVLELRVRQAVRRGARLLLANSGGGDLDHIAAGRIAAGEIEAALRDAEHPVLIATEPAAVAAAAAVAHAAGLGDGPGGVIAVPEGPNERGLHALGYRDSAAEVLRRAEDGTLQMLVVLGDADPLSCFAEPERWEAALQRCESVVASSLFPTPTALWAHVIVPATSALEKEGTTTNLEGRTQRLRPVLPAPEGVHPELALLAAAGRHLGLELAVSPSLAFRRVAESAPLFAGLTWETIGLTAPLPSERPRAGSAPAPAPPPAAAAGGDGLRALGRRPLFSGAAVARSERLSFQRSDEIVLAREDALRLGIAEGAAVTVRHAGGATTGPARLSRTLAPGAVRFAWDGAPVDGACTIEVEA